MGHSVLINVYRLLPFSRPSILRWFALNNSRDLDPILRIALKDKNLLVRCEALDAIQSLESSPAAHFPDSVFRVLNDSDASVREAAVSTLSRYPKPKYCQKVQTLVFDQDIDVKRAALDALLVFHCAADFVQKLLTLAVDPEQPPEIEELALQNISQAERLPVSLIPILLDLGKKNGDVALHLGIVEILAAYPTGDEMQKALLSFITHVDSDVHRPAIRALEDKGTRESIFFLEKIITDGKKPGQMMDHEDADLAQKAVNSIVRRYPLP